VALKLRHIAYAPKAFVLGSEDILFGCKRYFCVLVKHGLGKLLWICDKSNDLFHSGWQEEVALWGGTPSICWMLQWLSSGKLSKVEE